jgi:hypothetical protein
VLGMEIGKEFYLIVEVSLPRISTGQFIFCLLSEGVAGIREHLSPPSPSNLPPAASICTSVPISHSPPIWPPLCLDKRCSSGGAFNLSNLLLSKDPRSVYPACRPTEGPGLDHVCPHTNYLFLTVKMSSFHSIYFPISDKIKLQNLEMVVAQFESKK